MAGSFLTPSTWVTELMQAIDERKLRMEDYANLAHKGSEQPLMNLVVKRRLLMNVTLRRAPRFEEIVGNERALLGIHV
jgi:hypothetical protein